jgi:hypothetical protein
MNLKVATVILGVCLLGAPLVGAGLPGFELWRVSELQKREMALSKNVGPDHSARETLADYGDHRFRYIYRDADGFPEQHDNIVDIVIAKSGESTLLLGGKMLNQKASAGQGEYTGTGIEGGERHAIAAGDIIQIPAKVPHSFLVAKGQHFTYVLLKIPAKP